MNKSNMFFYLLFHVCRNVVLELYDQQQADPDNRDMRTIQTRDLGNGRTEVS